MITAPVMKDLRSIYLARLISENSSNTFSEAVVQRCSVKKVFLEISLDSQENSCARVLFLETLAQVFSCEFCEISKNNLSYRTPLKN